MIQGRKIANYSLNQILDIKNCTIKKLLPQLIHLVDKRPQCIQVYRYSYHRHGYTALTRAQSHSCTYSDILYHNYQQNTLCVCGRVCVVKRTEYLGAHLYCNRCQCNHPRRHTLPRTYHSCRSHTSESNLHNQ